MATFIRFPSCFCITPFDSSIIITRFSSMAHGSWTGNRGDIIASSISGRAYWFSRRTEKEGRDHQLHWTWKRRRCVTWPKFETWSWLYVGSFKYAELFQGGKIGNFRRICLCAGVQVMQVGNIVRFSFCYLLTKELALAILGASSL